jgi:hypothetical protein
MAYVYILKNGDENVFKIGRTKKSPEDTIRELSRGNPRELTKFDATETDEDVAGETYLHRKLRSKRVLIGGGREFFRVEIDELQAAIKDAREYLDEFISSKRAAEELSIETTTDAIVQPTIEDFGMYQSLCRVRQQQDMLCVEREYYEARLKLRIGTCAALGKLATWKSQIGLKFDQSAFASAEPKLFQQFNRECQSRVFRLK